MGGPLKKVNEVSLVRRLLISSLSASFHSIKDWRKGRSRREQTNCTLFLLFCWIELSCSSCCCLLLLAEPLPLAAAITPNKASSKSSNPTQPSSFLSISSLLLKEKEMEKREEAGSPIIHSQIKLCSFMIDSSLAASSSTNTFNPIFPFSKKRLELNCVLLVLCGLQSIISFHFIIDFTTFIIAGGAKDSSRRQNQSLFSAFS